MSSLVLSLNGDSQRNEKRQLGSPEKGQVGSICEKGSGREKIVNPQRVALLASNREGVWDTA